MNLCGVGQNLERKAVRVTPSMRKTRKSNGSLARKGGTQFKLKTMRKRIKGAVRSMQRKYNNKDK